METAVFWIAWGVISFWALKTFYYSFSVRKLENLRKAALGINLSVFILSFLPWLPPALDNKTGIMLAFEGNIFAVLFLFFLILSVVLFLSKTSSYLKIASIATSANTFILFTLMTQVRPGTFTLSLHDIAPIIAVLLLLVGDMVVLLLWEQLQLKQKKKMQKGFVPIWIILVIFLFGGLFAMRQGYLKFSSNNPTNKVTSRTGSPSATQLSGEKLSLREVCLDKIKDLPAPPFSYKSKSTVATLLPLYKRKERFPNEDKTRTCITDYSITDVKEQAFKDMGFDYYVPNKTTGRQLNYPAINGQFDRAVDAAYTELMKVKNWERVTPQGEREGGIPYIVYVKEEGVYKMYADVTQGTDMFFSVTLTVIGP